MNKHLLLIGDLGAGANLVKNICLLDDKLSCPWQNRYEFFKSIYEKSNFDSWLDQEYKTRFWKHSYGFDLSDSLSQQDLSKLDRTIFINHSAFWEMDKLKMFQLHCDIIFLTPLSEEGLRWQVRAYVEKKGIENLHNFSFKNPEIEKPAYIKDHGLEEYQKFNALNMYEICKRRRDELLNTGITVFDMTNAFKGKNDIVSFFNEKYNLNIPEIQADDIFNKWYSLHWDYANTDNWVWGEKYNG